MDYALLAATALGAIGLYMLLPRERAPLTRLGGLLSAMALAGFLLYLVRTVAVAPAGSGASGPPIYFYIFAIIMIAGAVGVICQPKPVYAALYFVLVTLAGAGIFVLLMAEFMAIVLIIIYAGAILVTYVFVIMLASQGSTGGTGGTVAPEYDRRASEPFVAVAVSFILMGAVLQVLFPSNGRSIAIPAAHQDTLMVASFAGVSSEIGTTGTSAASTQLANAPASEPAEIASPSNVQVLGASLYSHYMLSLELAGILLTIALVGAVVIARKNTGSMHDALGTGKLPAE